MLDVGEAAEREYSQRAEAKQLLEGVGSNFTHFIMSQVSEMTGSKDSFQSHRFQRLVFRELLQRGHLPSVTGTHELRLPSDTEKNFFLFKKEHCNVST